MKEQPEDMRVERGTGRKFGYDCGKFELDLIFEEEKVIAMVDLYQVVSKEDIGLREALISKSLT